MVLVGANVPLAAFDGGEGAVKCCLLYDLGRSSNGGRRIVQGGVSLELHPRTIHGAEFHSCGSKLDSHLYLYATGRVFGGGLFDDTRRPGLPTISSPQTPGDTTRGRIPVLSSIKSLGLFIDFVSGEIGRHSTDRVER